MEEYGIGETTATDTLDNQRKRASRESKDNSSGQIHEDSSNKSWTKMESTRGQKNHIDRKQHLQKEKEEIRFTDDITKDKTQNKNNE